MKKKFNFKNKITISIIILFSVISILPNVYGQMMASDVEPSVWWTLWREFPGRYEPFFDVVDIIDLGQTA